jgi:hypothetical protein
MDEIKAKVSYVQPELSLNYGQMSFNLEIDDWGLFTVNRQLLTVN